MICHVLRKAVAPATLLVGALTLAACASAPQAGSSAVAAGVPDATASHAAEVALSMVGRPYSYGGNTPAGFDCSGLVSYSYARAGVRVSRETRTLRDTSNLIRASSLRRGDLVFFHQEGKKYSHVGIYLGDGRFVHAPSSGGRVRTDQLNSDYWRRHFVEARRI